MEYHELKEYLESIPFWKHLGMKVMTAENGYAELYLPFKQELAQIANNMHGGALATLLDAAGATALLSFLEGKLISTVELKLNYLRPVTPQEREVTAYARAAHAGNSLGVSTIEVKNESEKLVAIGQGTYKMYSP